MCGAGARNSQPFCTANWVIALKSGLMGVVITGGIFIGGLAQHCWSIGAVI